MPNYIISARAVKNNKFIPEPGAPKFLSVPTGQEVTPRRAIKNPETWLNRVQRAAERRGGSGITTAGDVLIFVHGYNNDIPVVIKRHETLQKQLSAEGWKGIVVSFDWPSDDDTLNYIEDRSDAAETAKYLVTEGVRRLATRQEDGCETNVHLLGHSTGAYVIRKAFNDALVDGDIYKSHWRIGQVAFIGGDISKSSLAVGAKSSKAMFDRIHRLTNYSNGYDYVLGVSNAKRLGTRPRVGRHGLPDDAHPKAVNVDCSKYFRSLDKEQQSERYGTWEHSWHIGNRVWTRDLAMTLEGRMDRRWITTREELENKLHLIDEPRPDHDIRREEMMFR